MGLISINLSSTWRLTLAVRFFVWSSIAAMLVEIPVGIPAVAQSEIVESETEPEAAAGEPVLADPGNADVKHAGGEDAAAAADDVEHLLKDFPKGWVYYGSEPGVQLNAVWQLMRDTESPKESILVCLGKPDGYVRTEKEYGNFELGMEWKFPADPNGNSGVLLYVVEKDMIWPKSVQVQLHRPTAGSVFASNGAKIDNPLPARDLSRPLDSWNECLVACVDGRISVTLNGHKVGEVTGCVPQRGWVALQSEGAEIHFRNLWIKPLPGTVKRVSNRKLSGRDRRRPACPTDVPQSVLGAHDFINDEFVPGWDDHRSRESQRIHRALRRFANGKSRYSPMRIVPPPSPVTPVGPRFDLQFAPDQTAPNQHAPGQRGGQGASAEDTSSLGR